MEIPFSKYHGAGNDFILIDQRFSNYDLSAGQISLMCHRRFGIGADGLIIILPSTAVDFEMKYFNADGYEGSMCGNGGRCITSFAHALGIIEKSAHFKAIDGMHHAELIEGAENTTQISLGLGDVTNVEKYDSYFLLNTGSPHYVEFTTQIDTIDVLHRGRKLRYDQRFQPDGLNVNFVEIRDDGLAVKTYERGVEDVTLSCGTGVTASAIAAACKLGIRKGPLSISTPGGKLKVNFERDKDSFRKIELEGPATHVFSGKYKL